MSGAMTRLPPGFELERPVQTPAPAALPPGFELEQPEQPGMLSRAGTYVDNLVRQVAKGATFNFSDEIAAGAGAATGSGGTMGDRYTANLATERSRDKAFEAENPYTAMAAQIAGGIANPVTRFPLTGGLLRRSLMAGGAGGVLGAAAGFGEGEGNFADRGGAALTGGVTGAALGGALPVVAEGVSRLARRVAPYLGMNVPATDAQRVLLRDLERSGTSLDDVRAGLAGAGNQPMVMADVAGENVAGRAQQVARVPGAGRQMAADLVEGRGGLNQSARLEGEVKRAINAQDFTAAADDLIATRARTAGPAYDRALAVDTPVNVQPILDDISARLGTAKGDIKASLQKALSLFRDRSGKPDTTMAGLHQTKLALDAMLEKTPTNSVSRVARRELMQVQERLLSAMDEASGGAYGAARQAFAGPSRALDAMDLGKRILKGDADETAAEIAKLSPSERDFFRIGVSRALIDRVKNTGDTRDLSAVQNIWGSQGVRERVAAAFDDLKDFERFSDFMKNELTMAKTNAMVNPRAGSQTTPLAQFTADGQFAPPGTLFNAMLSAARGDMLGVGANVLRPYTRGEPDVSALAGEIAPYLFSMKAGDRARLLDALQKRQLRDQSTQGISRRLGDVLLRGGTVGAVQLEN